MPEFLSPSIQVVEVRQGVTDVQGVSTSTGGFEGKAEKGPINTATLVTSITQFQEVFGGPLADSYLFEQVDAFFKNGGSRCWITRVAHYTDITNVSTLTAVAASKTIQSAAGGATAGAHTGTVMAPFNLEPGDTLTVDVDGGGAAAATFDATAATKAGSGATYAALTGKTLVVQIDDDGDDQTITFTGSATDAATTAAEINDQLRKGKAEVNGGEIDLVSDKRGTGSKVDIKSGTGLVEIGHTVGAAAGTGDVADIDAVTHAEAKAVIEGDIPGLTYTPASGAGYATLTSDTTGASSSIQVSAGAGQTAFGFDTSLHSGSDTASPTDTITVTASSEGAWGNNVKFTIVRDDTTVTSLATSLAAGAATSCQVKSANQFRVGDWLQIADGTNEIRVKVTNINGSEVQFASTTVPAGGISAGTSYVIRERFSIAVIENGTITASFSYLAISSDQKRDYFVSRINNTENTPIFVTDLAAVVPDPRPAAQENTLLSGGSEGDAIADTDYVGSGASKTGLYAFDPIDAVNLVSIPGVTSVAVQKAILDYTTNRMDCFGILTLPAGLSPSQAHTYVTSTANLASSYAAAYYPWVKLLSTITGTDELTPVDGFAQGAYARTDRVRNVAKAPAGIVDGRLNGVTGVEREVAEGEYDILYPANINCVLNIPGSGICLFGSRTLETGEFRQIPVRRLFMFIEESLAEASRFVLFENNDPETRAAVTRLYKGFLRNLRLSKMLYGKSDAEAFFVICDERNNTQTVINSGLMKARVGVAVKKPTEFLLIEVMQDTRALDAELSA